MHELQAEIEKHFCTPFFLQKHVAVATLRWMAPATWFTECPPQESRVAQSCVWIVAGKTTGPLKLHVVEDEELTLQTDFKLAVISNPHNTDPHNFTCNYEEIT